MKRLFTLAAATALAAASLSAQAQVTVDGQLTAAELTAGNYVLIGRYTVGDTGFGDAGLLSLYAATTATKVTFFLGGTVEGNGNAFQLYFNVPAIPGVPAGTALPVGAVGSSFEGMAARMDMPVDLAIALRSDGAATPANSTFKVEGALYSNATTVVTAASLGSGLMVTGMGAGTPVTLTSTTITPLNGARVAYRAATGNKLTANPGGAAQGGAGSLGWEVELDRAAANLTGTASMQLFALQNSGKGDFVSSDYIPQRTAALPVVTPAFPTNNNLGANPNFAIVPGLQAATLNLTATGLTLATKAADAAAIGLSVFPNPSEGAATVQYKVADRASNVNIVLTDLLGRSVRVLENSMKAVGTQATLLNTSALAAGSYLVRVQVGDRVSTSKVSVL